LHDDGDYDNDNDDLDDTEIPRVNGSDEDVHFFWASIGDESRVRLAVEGGEKEEEEEMRRL
jgi:hypothetical protein